jgi:glycosyltransferase involved in cell wall biosynthesis
VTDEPARGRDAEPHGALVSICVPTYNGARWLREALESATSQSYLATEILVVDDRSDDRSAEIARSVADARIRVVVNERRLGMVANWNRCIALASGDFVKFLFQDDLLHAECVDRLVRPMLASGAVMSFSRRAIELLEPSDARSHAWKARFAELHAGFGPLGDVNDGPQLLRRQLARQPFKNWIGEPTSVLLRTETVRHVGGFNERLHQLVDSELWLRLMARGAVAFVDAPLVNFRVHPGSSTNVNRARGHDWLDSLWLAEALVGDPEVGRLFPAVGALRRRAYREVVRAELARTVRRQRPAILTRLGDLFGYVRWRVGRRSVAV